MPTIPVPSVGWAVDGSLFGPGNTSMSKDEQPQAMQLDLAPEILGDILKNARKDDNKTQLSLGKSPTLLVNKNIRHITLKPNNAWKMHFNVSRERQVKAMSRVSHKLQILLPKALDVETDPALMQLQQSLAKHEQKKQSNTSVFIKDNSKLPPAKSGKQPAPKTSSLSFLKSHRVGLFDHQRSGTTRSMPASPSLGAVTTSTTRPDEKTLKAEALKNALIHLLAVRPVSEKFICSSLRCNTADLEQVLHKYGRPSRLDPSKFDLSDKGYKELKVWRFNYKNQEDRQAAIDRAVKAYDRQRISREEKLWQLLLPKEERGKGKILSNLSLHEGPMQRVRTPQIHVQSVEDGNNGEFATGSDSDNRKGRLAPGDPQSMIRSRSQDPIKKQRVSEKEAQSRRLLSKNPKKSSNVNQNKETKSVTHSKEGKPAAKRETKKSAASEGSKIKSAEFIEDSDEDIEMKDVPLAVAAQGSLEDANVLATGKPPKHAQKKLPSSQHTATPKTKQPQSQKPDAKKSDARKMETKKPEAKKPAALKTLPQMPATSTPVAEFGKKATLTGLSGSGTAHRASDANQGSTSMKGTISHQRTTSSPKKPSPLGSSPPANASDFDLHKKNPIANGSSTSGSPLTTSSQETRRTKLNGIARAPNEKSEAKESGGSDRALKRKANDLSSDTHNHGGAIVTDSDEHPSKRRRNGSDSPPTSDSSNAASPALKSILSSARQFKEYYPRYLKAHQEVSAMIDPPIERVEKVMRMRERLVGLKNEIAQETAKLTC